MLGGEVKWFFPGLVINKSGENGEATCRFQLLFLAGGSRRGWAPVFGGAER